MTLPRCAEFAARGEMSPELPPCASAGAISSGDTSSESCVQSQLGLQFAMGSEQEKSLPPASEAPIASLSAGYFSSKRKNTIALTILLINFNTTLGSTLPSGSLHSLEKAFGVRSALQTPLPVAIFLAGYIVGPAVFGPLSEFYGRRPVFLISFCLYTIFLAGCIIAPNWSAFLIFRFLMGCGAAAPQTVSGGLFSDIYPDLISRGRVITLLGLTSNIGPLIGPIISGYTSGQDWRWQCYIALALVAVNWPLLLWMPETFLPVLRAKSILARRSVIVDRFLFPSARNIDNRLSFSLHDTILRPLRMTLDPLLFFTNLFILYQYIIFFLYFNIYPVVFQGIYGLSDGQSALMFLPTGLGALLAIFIYLAWDKHHSSAVAAGKTWALREEARRLPLACLGGPLFAVAEFWLGWTARSDFPFIVPALSGIPLGIGIDLTFLALQNYLTDAYGIYSASALTSSVITRNILAAALLPTVSVPLYEHLGTAWACTLLGGLCSLLVVIPFAFLRWGPLLREKSKFCKQLRELEC